MGLNIEYVRKQFPSLSGDWVFFENAGGTQVLQNTALRIADYLINSNVQLGASYEVSQRAGERVDEGIRAMGEYINASDKSEIILGASTSLLFRLLSISLGEFLKVGDEVIVTNCDHEANIGPWRTFEKKGITVKEWKINKETFDLEIEDLEKLMTEKTRFVALTHTSNVLGTINGIKKITSFVHERGAWIGVDGVAYAPHRLPDVKDLDVDFYAFSFYKVYGPHYSILYGKKEHLERLPGVNHFFLEKEIPYKFEPGHVNFELTYGLLGLKDYLIGLASVHSGGEKIMSFRKSAEIAFDLIAEHEERLSKRLLEFLNSKGNVRVIGKKEWSREIRVPTVSFVIKGKSADLIPVEVEKHKIAIRSGDFYARRLIDYLGLSEQGGVIRVSMVHYNTLEEVDRLISVLDKLI